MKKAVIYARYSAGPKQTDQSIDGQIRVCKDFCAQNGLTVVAEYCDKHISGTTDARPGFQKLIADAKRGEFEAVVVYKTDRFARNKYDSAIYKRELKKQGIKIYYAAESIPDGPEGIILESLMEGLAEYYSAELSQKIKRGMTDSALKCQTTGANRILGYKVGPDKHFYIDEHGAAAVRKIFDLYIKGISNSDICAELNLLGYKTATGQAFNKNSINRIVQNKKYTGTYIWQDISIPGGMPVIIDDDTFALAQQERENRRTRKSKRAARAEYLLAGKAVCGLCGSTMHGVSGTGKAGGKYYYYYCKETRGASKTCAKKRISKDALEATVVQAVLENVRAGDCISLIAEKLEKYMQNRAKFGSDRAELQTNLEKNKKAINNIVALIEQGPITETLPSRLAELEATRKALNDRLAALDNYATCFSKAKIKKALLQYGKQMDSETELEYKRRIISCFIWKVMVYDDKIIILFNISGDTGPLSKTMPIMFDERISASTKLFAGRTGSVHATPVGFAVVIDLPPH